MASSNGTTRDPAAVIPGAPPNMGEPMLPHVMSFAGIVSNLAKVYRPSDEAYMHSQENARFMRNDPVIMECVEARQRAAALLDWNIEPEDEKDATQKEVADELTRLVEAIPRFMQYRENLGNATFFGKYGVSQVWRKKMIRRKMRTAVTKWTPVHGDKIVFRFDDGRKTYDDSQVGIRCGLGLHAGEFVGQNWKVQAIGSSGGIQPTDLGMAYFLPKWQRSLLAIHKHQVEDGEFESPQYAGRIHGVGIRSRIYWLWYQKQETLAWLMEYLERSAAGFEIWYYQWGNDASEAAARKAATERIGNRNVILVPKVLGEDGGMSQWYERIEPSMAGAEAMKSIVIEYFGQIIKRYILGQTLTTEAAGTGLGSNLADVHMDTFMQIVKYDCRLLEETITEDLIKNLVKYNFPAWVNYDFKFKLKTEEDDVQDRLDAAKAAYEMGLRIPAKKIYELTSLTPPEEGEEVLSMAQQQAQGQPGMGQEGDPNGAAGAGGLPPGLTARFGADLQAKLGQALQATGPDGANEANQSANGANSEDYAAAEPIDAGQFDRAAFRRGLAAEMKETKDHTLASEIVLDNLQRDPRHYDMQALMGAADGAPAGPPSQNSERTRLATYAKDFKESEHPRNDDGEFAKGGKGKKNGEMNLPPQAEAALKDLIKQGNFAEKYIQRLKSRHSLNEDQLQEVFARINAAKAASDAQHDAAKKQQDKNIASARHVMQGLVAKFGEPDSSGLSFANYFHSPEGVRIRVADHAPVHGRSTAHVNVVTGGTASLSEFHPDTIVVDVRGKSPEEANSEVEEAIKKWTERIKRAEEAKNADSGFGVNKTQLHDSEKENPKPGTKQKAEKLAQEPPFTLENKAPKQAAPEFENLGGKQQNMWHGMNDLPGQKSMFQGLDLTSKEPLEDKKKSGQKELFRRGFVEKFNKAAASRRAELASVN